MKNEENRIDVPDGIAFAYGLYQMICNIIKEIVQNLNCLFFIKGKINIVTV